jgi:FeS assembly SUF system protein
MKNLPMIPPESSATPQPSGEIGDLVPDAAKTSELRPGIVDAISTVYDPEIPVNIWELGLIYDILVDAAGVAGIRMTLTAPGCPAAQSLPVEVAAKVRDVPGVTDARVDVVWEPPWDKDRMSEAAKLQLGLW